MEFGRVQEAVLDSIQFKLPDEPSWNKTILSGKAVKQPKVYIGCAKWGRTEWIGKIYPPKTKEKDFLSHYVQHYNCIELNATHYKIYGPAGIKKWAAHASNKDFMFCPKLYQGITHRGSLKGKDFITSEFLRGIVEFGDKLGPVFIQVSDSFSPNRKDDLFDYLKSLPKDLVFFLEVRHPDWFAKQERWQFMLEELKALNMGAVITDTSGRRDCAHMHHTIPKAFVRFVGNSLHPTDYTRIDEWIEKIKYWLDNGLEELYFFMHMHDETYSPELTVYIVDKLNAACNLQLAKPVFINNPTQSTLF